MKLVMKHSIRTKLAAAVVGLIAAAIAVCIVINFFFLSTFYMNNRIKDLNRAFDVVADIIDDGENVNISDIMVQRLTNVCDKYSISLLIADPSINKKYVYGDSTDILVTRLKNTLIKSTDGYVDGKIIENNEKYLMVRFHDKEVKLDYIELTAVMDSNVFLFMRGSVENASAYASLANFFFAFTGLCVIIVSIIIVSAISYKITYRILRLVRLSDNIANMEFSTKYTIEKYDKADELDILGYNMNDMAKKLEQNISELKTANIQLKKDIQEKTEIDEMRTQFLSNVSHELKTPLAIIQGYAEGLKENVNEDPESMEFYCDVIIDEAAKMNTMVKKLLTLNQIESGGGNTDIERFDIVEVIKQRLNSISILLEQKGANIVFDCHEPVYVWADEFKIEEVITNYLSNALNHLDGEMVIKITIEHISENVRVTIFNSGNHIPENDIDKIWDKFYKVDKARTREYGGSGIGLSIVKAIMNSHGKQCGAMNVMGGVAFWFEVEG